MEYIWRKRTQDYPAGHIRPLDPSSPHTRELIQRGIVEPYENKALDVPEVKAKTRRKRKAKADE